jgi:transposase
MTNFRPTDRLTGFLMPPSVDEWLPQTHLARFVAEVVDGLDLSAMSRTYRGSGSASYHPKVLFGVLMYGYATGVFSSRKLERATYDSVAFRFIAANDHPDHDTIATFRRRFLKEIEALFVQVLMLAREMGVLSRGSWPSWDQWRLSWPLGRVPSNWRCGSGSKTHGTAFITSRAKSYMKYGACFSGRAFKFPIPSGTFTCVRKNSLTRVSQ